MWRGREPACIHLLTCSRIRSESQTSPGTALAPQVWGHRRLPAALPLRSECPSLGSQVNTHGASGKWSCKQSRDPALPPRGHPGCLRDTPCPEPALRFPVGQATMVASCVTTRLAGELLARCHPYCMPTAHTPLPAAHPSGVRAQLPGQERLGTGEQRGSRSRGWG